MTKHVSTEGLPKADVSAQLDNGVRHIVEEISAADLEEVFGDQPISMSVSDKDTMDER